MGGRDRETLEGQRVMLGEGWGQPKASQLLYEETGCGTYPRPYFIGAGPSTVISRRPSTHAEAWFIRV